MCLLLSRCACWVLMFLACCRGHVCVCVCCGRFVALVAIIDYHFCVHFLLGICNGHFAISLFSLGHFGDVAFQTLALGVSICGGTFALF